MQKKRFQLSLDIIHCTGFISMSAASQALYMQLVSTCDDEGFTSQLSVCAYMAHATEENVNELIDKEFIYVIGERKTIVIKHWKMNTYMRDGVGNKSDFEERELVYLKSNGNYALVPEGSTRTECERNETESLRNTSSSRSPMGVPAGMPDGRAQNNPIQSNPNTYQSNTSKRVTSKQRTREEDEVEVMDLYNHEDNINEILEKSKDEEMF